VHRLGSQSVRAPPTGYVAPWWEFSPVTNELLLKKGIKYDHSLMHKDFEPTTCAWGSLDADRLLEEAAGMDEAVCSAARRPISSRSPELVPG